MKTDYCVVYCTCPDSAQAEKIAHRLAELKLVACTNIVPHLTSIYPWEGKLIRGCEAFMIMKTHQNKLPDLEKAILELHPYTVPEIIALPIIYANKKYLDWINKEVEA